MMNNELSPDYVLNTISDLGLKFRGPEFGDHIPRSSWDWLVFCILSLRTRDEVSRATYKKLHAEITTVQDMINASLETITQLVYPCGFYKRKAVQLQKLAQIIHEKYQGHPPKTEEELRALPGVGLKTANFVLSRAYNIPAICVDIHVHRISNRLGWVNTKNPAETEKALKIFVPQYLWILINNIIVPFGQHICLPTIPHCGRCPLDKICPKIKFDNSCV